MPRPQRGFAAVLAAVVAVAVALTAGTARAGDIPQEARDTGSVVASALRQDPSGAGRRLTHSIGGGSGVSDEGLLWADTQLGRVSLATTTAAGPKTRHGDLRLIGDTAVRKTPDGAQGLSVLRSPQAPAPRWKLQLPRGTTATLAPDGSVALRSSSSAGTRVLSSVVERPWAVDARGKQLATHYSIEGQFLVQHVDLRGAAFPVVADPRLTYGWGVYLNMWGYEIVAVGVAVVAAGGAAAIYACQRGYPGTLGVLLRIVCVVVGAPSVISLLQTIVAIYRGVNRNACYQTKILPRNGRWVIVNGSNCSG